MERGFLGQKGSGDGRGVKEKNQDGNVEKCLKPIRSIAAPNEGIVTDSPTNPNKSGMSLSGPTSYAKLVTREPSRESVNFCTLLALVGNEADVAYPIVDNYVKNTWSKYGLVKSMLNRLTDVGNAPVWVKFHGVPTTTFSEDGLSFIATKLCTPLMPDSYTSEMYMQSWDRSNECPKKIVLDMVKNLKNPRQAARGVQVPFAEWKHLSILKELATADVAENSLSSSVCLYETMWRNRVNNEADPAFTAAIAHAVVDLLSTLIARITDEIRQNENNRNNGDPRNARRVNTEGSGNDGDAQLISVKENSKKDKIGSKSDKNEMRGEAGKSQKQLQ
nr:hypothetical protein [Tanacetum cinerariifolium]